MNFRSFAAATPTGVDAHFDTPLANIAIMAFQGSDMYIGQQLFPIVPVGKQSDKYYIIDQDSWLIVPDTKRSPKKAPNRVEFRVSSDSYFANNFALAGENAVEDLANADVGLMLRENTVNMVTDALLRDYEVRVANKVTSGTNLGSYVSLSGATAWSDFVNSNPLSDVTTGHAFIENTTGIKANTMVIDANTLRVVRKHPVLLDMYKYTTGGLLSMENLKDAFEIENVLVGKGIKNMAVEGAAGSTVNIWGNNVIMAYVSPSAVSRQTRSFGLTFRWTPPGLPAPMSVRRYNDPDPGKGIEVVDVGYFQDEKIVASNLSYGILNTL